MKCLLHRCCCQRTVENSWVEEPQSLSISVETIWLKTREPAGRQNEKMSQKLYNFFQAKMWPSGSISCTEDSEYRLACSCKLQIKPLSSPVTHSKLCVRWAAVSAFAKVRNCWGLIKLGSALWGVHTKCLACPPVSFLHLLFPSLLCWCNLVFR